jgi:glycerol kinase
MSLGTRPAHVARAVLEGIALQISDIVFAMDADLGTSPATLSVDGGAAGNDLLVQILADAIGRPVRLAAEAAGLVSDPWPEGLRDRFEPMMREADRDAMLGRWRAAVKAAARPAG